MKDYLANASNLHVLDGGTLQHSAPEGGKLMGVVDLDHVELLQNAVVQSQLLTLELGQFSIPKVYREQVQEILVDFDLALDGLNHVRHAAGILVGLEDCSERLLAGVHIL